MGEYMCAFFIRMNVKRQIHTHTIVPTYLGLGDGKKFREITLSMPFIRILCKMRLKHLFGYGIETLLPI